ncbi:MAG TPA: CBS domain-containing protein [Gemmatimonadaceae bacterium]
MLKIQDIMTTSVVTLPPEATLREAMESFAVNHLSAVPVVAGERVLGLISMTDILNFVVESSHVSRQTAVADVMNYEVFSVAPSSSIRSAAEMMKKRGIHRVLVMEDRKLLGIVSALDIARFVSDNGLPGKTGVRRDPCCDDPSPWITV